MVATVTSLTSAAVTTRYFERDGYYAKSDPEHRKASRWHGEGANPFQAAESEELLARIETLAGDGRVPASRRESLDRILADHAGISATGSSARSGTHAGACRPGRKGAA